jgi:hypothetical protein
MAAFNGDALSALRQALTLGDTVDPAGGVRVIGTITLGDPGVAATSLGKAEDAAHTSGDVGVMALAVRNDNASSTVTNTNTDYSQLSVDLTGAIFVSSKGTANNIGKQEDVNHTSGDGGVPAWGVRNDTDATPTSATGDYSQLTTDSAGRQKVVSPLNWSIAHTPAANTQATTTQALASGFRHVATSISFTLAADTGIVAAATVLVNLRDGVTGAGTILWSQRVSVPATAGSCTAISLGPLSVPGTAGTAMTLEFAAAGGASTFESVALTGYDVV